ncbi:MAG: HlyD family type I secretion periplasmic adaptor subunit [Hyphomonadaceae bacterium]|nr:HlyD family type I secretion periplasmic adaptor subunit [Hyphomonadaceae bacterium]
MDENKPRKNKLNLVPLDDPIDDSVDEIDSEPIKKLIAEDGRSKKGAKSRKSYRRYLMQGYAGAVIFVLGGGLWASTTEIDGAIIASGYVVVESEPKTIQHFEGGIVQEILVRNGDNVKVDDVLLRLNPVDPQSNSEIVQNRLYEAMAKVARLNAEQQRLGQIKWPNALQDINKPENFSDIIAGQTKLFEARRKSINTQTAQLRQRIRQTTDQISGLYELLGTERAQKTSIEAELENLRTLQASGYVSGSKVMSMERQKSSIDGNIATHEADVARLNSTIGELELQISQVRRDADAEILAELREAESVVADLTSQNESLKDKMQRVEIRAPVAGLVHDMSVTTIGGVVLSGEAIMQIIPRDDKLVIDARVAPKDIDQVYKTQNATVNLSAFNQRSTPQLTGQVIDISADILEDKNTGLFYYTTRVEIPAPELERLADLKLIPGMPAEVFMTTGKRTVSSYLLKPVTDTMKHAFRED